MGGDREDADASADRQAAPHPRGQPAPAVADGQREHEVPGRRGEADAGHERDRRHAAADRVRRLRQAGVITGFTALVDPAAGGRRLEAIVGVTLTHGVDSDRFATEAERLAPVTEVLHLAGAPDYLLRVSCHDTAELDILLRTLRIRLGASDTETKIVLRSGAPPA